MGQVKQAMDDAGLLNPDYPNSPPVWEGRYQLALEKLQHDLKNVGKMLRGALERQHKEIAESMEKPYTDWLRGWDEGNIQGMEFALQLLKPFISQDDQSQPPGQSTRGQEAAAPENERPTSAPAPACSTRPIPYPDLEGRSC